MVTQMMPDSIVFNEKDFTIFVPMSEVKTVENLLLYKGCLTEFVVTVGLRRSNLNIVGRLFSVKPEDFESICDLIAERLPK